MVSPALLTETIDQAFRTTASGHRTWPDPHAGFRTPLDEEYSRLTDPGRYRIIGARADAWLVALDELGIARRRHDAQVAWAIPPGPVVSAVDLITSARPGTIPLVIVRSRLGEIDGAGVVVAVGDPAVEVQPFPDCGCDACDSGSQAELDHLDEHLLAIVTGRFRHLRRRDQTVMTLGDGGFRASGGRRLPDARRVLADPRGWTEISGSSWL